MYWGSEGLRFVHENQIISDFQSQNFMICLMTPKCFIPVKRARPRNLEKDLVIIEKDREVLGHHQVMADGALKLICS